MPDLRVPDLNRVLIAGRLTRDAELSYTTGGTAFCKFGIANTRYYKTKDGGKGEETAFVEVVTWAKTAEFAAELTKGRAVLVEGRLSFSEWQDSHTGQKRTKLEVNAERVSPLDWAEKREARAAPQESRPAPAQERQETIPEDEIPF